jgi:hypothetical protein
MDFRRTCWKLKAMHCSMYMEKACGAVAMLCPTGADVGASRTSAPTWIGVDPERQP